MNKSFITNLIILVGLNLLVKPFYILFVEAEVQNRVGAEQFGNYFALLNFSFLLNILLDLGVTNWNSRHVARHPKLMGKYLARVVPLRILLALGYMAVVVLAGILLGYSWRQFDILLLLGFNQILASFILYFRSNLTGLHLFRHDSVISVLDRFILLTGLGGLLLLRAGTFKVEWLVWWQTAAYTITVLVAYFMVKARAGKQKFRFNADFSKLVLKDSFPFAVLVLFSMIAYRVDSVMLERMAGPREAGIYAMGFRFFEAYNMIAYLFAVLLLPMFARQIRMGENVSELLVLSFKLLFSGTLLFTLSCFFYPFFITKFFYENQLDDGSLTFRWLMPGCIFFAMQYIFGTLLTANGNLRILGIIAVFAMVLNIGLNLFLIPQAGARGTAWANGITQFAILAAQLWFVFRTFKPQLPRGFWIRLAVFSTGSIVFISLGTINRLNPGWALPAGLAASFTLAIGTRMIDAGSFVRLLRSRAGDEPQ